ncbi:hypothetical protein N9H48_08410 [Pseudoalteromonas marina]|nr:MULTISPECIES: hypothetical protein [unclassified Pseudoalteromonas]MBW4965951.1 hypothetical protein [Pseudoalteromonas sp. CR1]MDA8940411.1 hypothetical protein [Pseudoalteromonas marina]
MKNKTLIVLNTSVPYNASLRSEFRLAKLSDEGTRASRDESFFNDLYG